MSTCRHSGDAPEEERAAIVAKYELGRYDNSHIYPWEDPGFEVYHVTDRYGFLQYVLLQLLKEIIKHK
ncbi:UNVERIFIED_CONTAM: USP6 N-terminal-like protein [Trichonephila clavipes]